MKSTRTVLLSVSFWLSMMLWSPAQSLAQSCAEESTVKSTGGGVSTEISFLNPSNVTRKVYWLDEHGRRQFYGAVKPNTILKQPTTSGDAWVVADENEKCVSIVVASTTPMTFDVATPEAPPADGAPSRALAEQSPGDEVASPLAGAIGFVGLKFRPLTVERAKELGVIFRPSVEVTGMTEGGPADKAGLLIGDIIYLFDDIAVSDAAAFANLVMARPLQTIRLKVIRRGDVQAIPMTIGQKSRQGQDGH